MSDISFGGRLKLLRKNAQLTQVDAARLIHISYKALQDHEGGRWPNKNNLEKYIEFYGCDQNWLLTGLGARYKSDTMEGGPLRTGESVAEYIKVDTPGLGQAVEMLATILASGNQVFSQAVMLSLRASSDALSIMKQRNQQMAALVSELNELRNRLAALEEKFQEKQEVEKEENTER